MGNYYNSSSPTKVSASLSIPFGTIGFITWIVFMIMDYGCHMDWIVTANNAISAGGHFWTWFPFWLPWALLGVELIFIIVFVVIATLISNH